MSKLLLTLIFTLVTACAGHAPRKEFSPPERIQSIALSEHAHIYAQDDVVLTHGTLDEKLSGLNEAWKHDLHKARVDRGIAFAAFMTQVAALAICIGQTNSANVLGWCAGSVAMGFVSIPFRNQADRYENGVINQYNETRKTMPEAGMN